MTAPEVPAGAALSAGGAAPAGPTDSDHLDAILADDGDIERHRQAIFSAHVMDGSGPVMSALARISGLTEQLDNEVRIIRLYLGEA